MFCKIFSDKSGDQQLLVRKDFDYKEQQKEAEGQPYLIIFQIERQTMITLEMNFYTKEARDKYFDAFDTDDQVREVVQTLLNASEAYQISDNLIN